VLDKSYILYNILETDSLFDSLKVQGGSYDYFSLATKLANFAGDNDNRNKTYKLNS
jgi:hypothetical protein